MASGQDAPAGPDLRAGIATGDLPDGKMMAGQVDGEAVLLAHRGDEWFAIGAACSHYSGPLPEGLMVGDTVRCPWHHACFSLRTGQAAPSAGAQRSARWDVEERDGSRSSVGAKRKPVAASRPSDRSGARVRAHRRRRRGRRRPRRRPFGATGTRARSPSWTRIRTPRTIGPTSPRTTWPATRRRNGSRCIRPSSTRSGASSSARPAGDVDRPEQPPRASRRWDRPARTVPCSSPPGPARCGSPADMEPGSPQVHYLRSLADSRRIVGRGARRRPRRGPRRELHRPRGGRLAARAQDGGARRGPGRAPARASVGTGAGRHDPPDCTRSRASSSIWARNRAASTGGRVMLETASALAADLLVAGIGVRPNLELAEGAGLALDRGVAGGRAAGDQRPRHLRRRRHRPLARPAHRRAHPRRALGRCRSARARRPREASWARASGSTRCRSSGASTTTVAINYVGHAERWDRIEIDGDVAAKDCAVGSSAARRCWLSRLSGAIGRASRPRRRSRPLLPLIPARIGRFARRPPLYSTPARLYSARHARNTSR